jgi:hypothetical protein
MRAMNNPQPPINLAEAGELINFYSEPGERRRGVAALGPAEAGIVLAVPRADIPLFSKELQESGRAVMSVSLVEITSDWRRSMSHVLDACLHSQQTHRSVTLLTDFAGEVHYGQIFELESLLRSATREWAVRCITQYDASRFTEPIDVDALSRFGAVLFGNYYQGIALARRNHRSLVSSPEKETADASSGD